jgi:hypothetical protein
MTPVWSSVLKDISTRAPTMGRVVPWHRPYLVKPGHLLSWVVTARLEVLGGGLCQAFWSDRADHRQCKKLVLSDVTGRAAYHSRWPEQAVSAGMKNLGLHRCHHRLQQLSKPEISDVYLKARSVGGARVHRRVAFVPPRRLPCWCARLQPVGILLLGGDGWPVRQPCNKVLIVQEHVPDHGPSMLT